MQGEFFNSAGFPDSLFPTYSPYGFGAPPTAPSTKEGEWRAAINGVSSEAIYKKYKLDT
ncbi:hypothetical protein MKY34_08285 [Sporosarcina sp. FSL K6-1522]|uniref:hypothetical protein n=1 Tax=Sporosarcina sp. FSL K6-1522 TaxID=2921554 RepID=UPI003159A0C4